MLNQTMRALVIGLISTVASLSLSHGGTAIAQTPERGGTLTVGFASDIKTLDPVFSIEYTERQVLYLIFDTLVKLDTDFSIKPELAKSWEIQNGGTRVLFHLREGVKFQDGTPFDAAAVKWNIDRRLDPEVKSPQKGGLESVLTSVEVVDPLTVAFNLREPYPGLLGMLGQREGFMESPSAAQKLGGDFGSKPVGAGAFVFKEWVRGNHITVERNPDYWDKGKPYLDRVVFQDIAGSVVGAQRLITGEADFVSELSPQDVRQIEGRSDIKLDPDPVGRWISLQWQVDKPPFDNALLRQAIAHAIDRKRLVDILMGGRAQIAEGPTPKGLWWFDPGLKSYDYDPIKAKDLLRQAGYPNGLDVTLAAPTVTMFQQLDQVVQEQLKAIGINVTLEPVAVSDWYSQVVQQKINFTPQRWSQRPDPDGLLYILFHSKGYANSTNYRNPELDALLDKARSLTDVAARRPLYWQAQAIITKDLPYVPLFFSLEYAALRSNVQGYVWIPDEIPRFRDVWKSKS
jgi:peptide/nickel transport system substrate-binding protein